MFKYISEIIKQFSAKQKILALLLLLSSGILISYITLVTKTPTELKNTIVNQDKIIERNELTINKLSNKLESLNDSILLISSNCNKKALDIESHYSKKMIEQQRMVNEIIADIENIIRARTDAMNIVKSNRFDPLTIDSTVHISPSYEVMDVYNKSDDVLILRLLNEIKVIGTEEIMP